LGALLVWYVVVSFQRLRSWSRTDSAVAWYAASSSRLAAWRASVVVTWRTTVLATCCVSCVSTSLALSASFQTLGSPIGLSSSTLPPMPAEGKYEPVSERWCALGRRGVGTPIWVVSMAWLGPAALIELRRDMAGWCRLGVREPGGVDDCDRRRSGATRLRFSFVSWGLDMIASLEQDGMKEGEGERGRGWEGYRCDGGV
jgi:hypothetical protein